MIIEPTGWELKCDACTTDYEVAAEPYNERDLLARACDEGWISAVGWHFCSLDCLLVARHVAVRRRAMAVATRAHMAGHATACCRLHRTHATRGRHHWDGECVDPNKAGVAVL